MRLRATADMIGSVTNATNAMHPTKSKINCPYSVKMPNPLSETDVNTNPIIPIGAHWIIPRTTFVTALAQSVKTSLVVLLAMIFRARPNTIDQNRIPKYSPSAKHFIGFENIVKSIFSIISPRPPGTLAVLAEVR